MTDEIEKLVARLNEIAAVSEEDEEHWHPVADAVLVDFIEEGLPPEMKGRVRSAFDAVKKWYA